MDYTVKDSGEREEYESGMKRDTQKGKPDYDLIDETFLERLAIHLTKGAEKYGEDNWRKANSEAEMNRFRKSATRHFHQWKRGDIDEDHMAATCFNLFAYEYVKSKLSISQTPIRELVDGNIYNIKIISCQSHNYWYNKKIGHSFSGVYYIEYDANMGEACFYLPSRSSWVVSRDAEVLW